MADFQLGLEIDLIVVIVPLTDRTVENPHMDLLAGREPA